MSKAKESLFSSKTNGRFYDEDGRIIGTSIWYKFSVASSIFSFFMTVMFLSASQALHSDLSAQILLPADWITAAVMPVLLSYSLWMFMFPLVSGIIALRTKRYNSTGMALWIVSISAAFILLWILSLLVSFSIL